MRALLWLSTQASVHPYLPPWLLPRDGLIPSRVSGLMEGRTVVSIAGGWRHSVAVDTAGSLYAWGWNKVRPDIRCTLTRLARSSGTRRGLHDRHDSRPVRGMPVSTDQQTPLGPWQRSPHHWHASARLGDQVITVVASS